MYYIWSISERFPNAYWLQYDWKSNPDYLDFEDGQRRQQPDKPLKFFLQKKANLNNFSSYDYLLSDALNLFSEKLGDLVNLYASKDIQLIESIVFQGEKFLGKYYVPIVLNIVDCIDKKNSVYNKKEEEFEKIDLIPNSLGDHKIVKAKKYEDGNMIVSEDFMNICLSNNIKGVEFCKTPYFNKIIY